MSLQYVTNSQSEDSSLLRCYTVSTGKQLFQRNAMLPLSEVPASSEMSITIYHSTWHHVPEDSNSGHSFVNPKPHNMEPSNAASTLCKAVINSVTHPEIMDIVLKSPNTAGHFWKSTKVTWALT